MKININIHLIIICISTVILSLFVSIPAYSNMPIDLINDNPLIEQPPEQVIKISYFIGIVIGLFISFFQPVFTIGLIALFVWLLVLIKDSTIKYRSIFYHGIKPYYIILIGQVVTTFIILPLKLNLILDNGIHSIIYTAIFLMVWWFICKKKFQKINKAINIAFMGTSFILILFTIVSNYVI